ncbi:U-box domain-containing protein 2 [Selaginella moellendorffii]|uniref:U-box domain-containing protein 2 n=1 Tax=Selaginella moellendorffii TaxID=88036 RepID=UPI000D1CE542|nr:U-box domain-containing protein 2 [Selaginella moellendorffii]|eukprot:XP_002981351.2 U-box domain-containing protein 2 [Selaginella moellendorffii]
MENGTLLVDIALSIRMIIHMCESAKSQQGNCLVLAAQLRLLKQLFDELRQSKFPLSDATIEAFGSLQSALQGAKEVLGQCSKGSKIYSFLKSPQCVDQFQELSAEIETILSASRLVLPRVSKQVQCMAENCVLELRKASYSKDVLEEQIRQEIEALLCDHREGRKASREKLDKLAGCLGITTKEQISEELNALEKDRGEAGRNKDKLEEEFIDQVISLFMQLAEDNFDDGDVKGETQSQEVQIPADFRCPLSLELMYDPVIVASGQTYERAYIQHWLDQGNTRCPKTGKPLAHINLIPNYTVKALIASWCQTNDVPLPKVDAVKSTNWLPPTFSEAEEAREDTSVIPSGLDTDCEERSSDHGSSTGIVSGRRKDKDDVYEKRMPSGPVMRVRSSSTYSSELSGEVEALGLSPSRNSPDHFPIFTRQMQSSKQKERKSYKSVYAGGDKVADAGIERLVQNLASTDLEAQRSAASELRVMTKNSIEDRNRIAHAGGITPLIALLSSGDAQTQENAVTALLNLSLNEHNKAEIAEAGAIDPLIDVLKSGTSDARENAAATLCSISVEDYKEKIGARGAIPLLVDLLRTGTPRGKKDAALALHNLSLFRENKVRIVAAGGVKPLINLICEPRMGMVDRAVDVLVTLSSIPEGRMAIGEEGGIPPLVEVVEAGSPLAKERAAAALLQLCTNNPKYRRTTLQEGALPPLYILSQIGTSRAKEKAAGILRLFREQRQASMSRRNRHM